MASRIPLVLSTQGQVEQLPDGDFLNVGKLNVGSPEQIVVSTNTIVVSKSYVEAFSFSNIVLDQIDGGEAFDFLFIRGQIGTSRIRVQKNTGNIFGGNKRDIDGPDKIIMLLNTDGNNWIEVSWQG